MSSNVMDQPMPVFGTEPETEMLIAGLNAIVAVVISVYFCWCNIMTEAQCYSASSIYLKDDGLAEFSVNEQLLERVHICPGATLFHATKFMWSHIYSLLPPLRVHVLLSSIMIACTSLFCTSVSVCIQWCPDLSLTTNSRSTRESTMEQREFDLWTFSQEAVHVD